MHFFLVRMISWLLSFILSAPLNSQSNIYCTRYYLKVFSRIFSPDDFGIPCNDAEECVGFKTFILYHTTSACSRTSTEILPQRRALPSVSEGTYRGLIVAYGSPGINLTSIAWRLVLRLAIMTWPIDPTAITSLLSSRMQHRVSGQQPHVAQVFCIAWELGNIWRWRSPWSRTPGIGSSVGCGRSLLLFTLQLWIKKRGLFSSIEASQGQGLFVQVLSACSQFPRNSVLFSIWLGTYLG